MRGVSLSALGGISLKFGGCMGGRLLGLETNEKTRVFLLAGDDGWL